MIRKYYTLRFEHSDTFHKSGYWIENADNLLHIGQAEGADVRLPNNSQYEDAEWAVIDKRTDGNGWKLIRTSPYREHDVRVNGEIVTYVHFLKKGDRISFEGQRQELLFDIREDDKYKSSGIVQNSRKSRTGYLWLSLVSVIVVAYIVFVCLNLPMTEGMIDEAKQSVFQIKVDSISLLEVQGKDTTLLETCNTDIKGVAFLTTDSLLITARHCIEPWLNIPDTLNLDTVCTHSVYVRMALKAETHNALVDDGSIMYVVSHCSVWQTNPNPAFLFSAKSLDFCMNKERDQLVECGDYEHQYVWRSISARPRRTDMMLGDIAFLPINAGMMENPRGTIRLATKGELQNLCGKDGRQLVILGSPVGSLDGNDIERTKDELRRALRFAEDGNPTTVLSHNGEITPGFSGGPVLTKCGVFGWCAIGVISATDKKNDKRCYSVPVTEIERTIKGLK